LFVTHNLPEAAYMSDFVVTLSQRPARVQELVVNALPSPRRWGAAVYEFAANLEGKVTLREEER
jgi:ABC-type nitrate/sulfonate/bicarbonate transport system ATPase subunit